MQAARLCAQKFDILKKNPQAQGNAKFKEKDSMGKLENETQAYVQQVVSTSKSFKITN